MTEPERIYSVSEFVETLRHVLHAAVGTLAVQGEISGYNVARGTMIFFELKDAQSRISCFCMAWELTTPLRDGMEVRVLGEPSLFQKSGKLHIRVQAVELVGQGALQQALEVLRAKLTADGIFAEGRKRALPRFPEHIGLITSAGAAAYTDVVQKLADRWPLARIRFAPVAVQGLGAARQIVRALGTLGREEKLDVIILTRGGGSLEDLQAFNDESVVRAIFASPIPVVCGVGHERDWTLADFAADRRASTPTNAAELVSPDKRELARTVSDLSLALQRRLQTRIDTRHHEVQELVSLLRTKLSEPERVFFRTTRRFSGVFRVWYHTFAERRRALPRTAAQLTRACVQVFRRARGEVEQRVRLLESLSPKATLKRGYSITRVGKTLLRSAKSAHAGDALSTELADGSLTSIVEP